MDRPAIVAGQFYPGAKAALDKMVRAFMDQAGDQPDLQDKAAGPTLLAMVPHAGYVYSGEVAGRTLGRANLAGTILLLGPNHTGRGQPLAVWPDGNWDLPGGAVAVDAELARAILSADPRLRADVQAHLGEHSLEVVLPFLVALDPQVRIVPVAVAETRLDVLGEVGTAVAGVLSARAEPVTVVVSSDMSHYLPQDMAKERDSLALKAVLERNPEELYSVVRRNNITMCGVLPMVLGLTIANLLGASKAELAAYATSGDASGDYARVVGYAGVLMS